MRKKSDLAIKPSEITPEGVYMNRRALLAAAVAAGLVPSIMSCEAATLPARGEPADVQKRPDSTTAKVNSFQDITTYNNFYEFGTGKSDPAANAHTLKT